MSESQTVPEEFSKVIKDFVSDIKTTFPEFNSLIYKWWKSRKRVSCEMYLSYYLL